MKDERQYQFYDLLPMTNWLQALVVAYLLMTLAYAAMMAMELQLPTMGAVLPLAHRMEAGVIVAGSLQALLLLTCATCYLVWVCRASNNVHALGAAGTRTPAWAVGSYFIPVANIGLGFHAMTQIWKASHSPSQWTKIEVPRWVVAWWLAWLIAAGITWYDLISSHGGNYSWIDRNHARLVGQVFSLVAGVLLLLIVRRIARLQRDSQSRRSGPTQAALG